MRGSGVGTGSFPAPYAQITQNHEPVLHPLVGSTIADRARLSSFVAVGVRIRVLPEEPFFQSLTPVCALFALRLIEMKPEPPLEAPPRIARPSEVVKNARANPATAGLERERLEFAHPPHEILKIEGQASSRDSYTHPFHRNLRDCAEDHILRISFLEPRGKLFLCVPCECP